jgi:hypothetical protein
VTAHDLRFTVTEYMTELMTFLRERAPKDAKIRAVLRGPWDARHGYREAVALGIDPDKFNKIAEKLWKSETRAWRKEDDVYED